MAGKHVPSQAAPGHGPEDATSKVGAHFTGRGGYQLPGPRVGDPDGDGDNDRGMGGQDDDRNPVTG